MDSKD